MHYTIKVDLKKLEGAFTGAIRGVNCVIIPVEANHIFCTEKGAAYLDLFGLELKEAGKFGGTHLIKRALTKPERDANKEVAILGDMKPLPTTKTATAPAPAVAVDDEEDLPF